MLKKNLKLFGIENFKKKWRLVDIKTYFEGYESKKNIMDDIRNFRGKVEKAKLH